MAPLGDPVLGGPAGAEGGAGIELDPLGDPSLGASAIAVGGAGVELGALGGSAPSAGGAWSELERLDPRLGTVVILGTSCTCITTPLMPYFDPAQDAGHGLDAQM